MHNSISLVRVAMCKLRRMLLTVFRFVGLQVIILRTNPFSNPVRFNDVAFHQTTRQNFSGKKNSLCKPITSCQRYDYGTGRYPSLKKGFPGPQFPDERQQDARYCELPGLYTQVEAYQRNGDASRARRDSHISQDR